MLDVINCIATYFSISKEAASYLYYRRRRSYPWRKKNDPKYLFWNARFQNSLIALDKVPNFNWQLLEFGKETDAFELNGIDMATQPINLFRDQTTEDGWTNICSKKHISLLQKNGLLPDLKKNNRNKEINTHEDRRKAKTQLS